MQLTDIMTEKMNICWAFNLCPLTKYQQTYPLAGHRLMSPFEQFHANNDDFLNIGIRLGTNTPSTVILYGKLLENVIIIVSEELELPTEEAKPEFQTRFHCYRFIDGHHRDAAIVKLISI